VFDSAVSPRNANGELSCQIYREVGDPTRLTVLYNWFQSPYLIAAREEAGIQSPPSATFLQEA
jgi:hypothetical protein